MNDPKKLPPFRETPAWLRKHRSERDYYFTRESGEPYGIHYEIPDDTTDLLYADLAFNNHENNGGKHVSPYDTGKVDFGAANLSVRLLQGINEEQMKTTLRRTIRATNGVDPDAPDDDTDPEEMFKGGLQTALESQVLVFEVTGASRVLTHQIVRSRRAAFHQQSQRATWYGDRPNQRWPISLLGKPDYVKRAWDRALLAAWQAYKLATDEGMSYQDARYILPEGTTNYILCEYSIRELIALYAYRGCSMFQWEMVKFAREARRVLVEAHPFIEPYVKISCEKTGSECPRCKGSGWIHTDGTAADQSELDRYLADNDAVYDFMYCDNCAIGPDRPGTGYIGRKCTFQGWENVEQQCAFPWAKQDNRVFLPDPRNRIGKG